MLNTEESALFKKLQDNRSDTIGLEREATPHPAGSLPPDYRHSRLTIVRRGCKT